MKIVGRRLTLRYPTADDAPALLTLGSDPAVTRFFSWGPYRELAEPLAYIARLTRERERGERLDLLIDEPGRGPLGIIGLSELAARDRRAVVGTWLGREHWGTGANREAKALIARFAFEFLGLERLGAYADLENPRSQAALSSIGFIVEGRLRRFHRHGETVHDVLVYSWLRAEWLRSPLVDEPAQVLGQPPPAFSATGGVGGSVSGRD
ncbi:MAG: GNAT family N-acetyltransferase [Solirubrobacteraceae bacterium]